jgi:hypothetical protein
MNATDTTNEIQIMNGTRPAPKAPTIYPTRRTYQKEIRIRTEQWSQSNGGRTPRGYGAWAFAPTALERADTGSQDARDRLLAATIWTKGTYAQARHEATKQAAIRGETDLTVLP